MTLKEKLAKAAKLAKSMGLDFDFEIKAAEAGDACQLDDGTAGVMSDDGSGNLVCKPTKDAAKAQDGAKPVATDPDGDGDDDSSDSPNADEAMDFLQDTLEKEHTKHKEYSTESVEKYTEKCGKAEDSKAIEGLGEKMKEQVDSEHDRHDKVVVKAIQEFHGKKKTEDKGIQEFGKKLKAEHADHREKCMKAIQEFHKSVKEDCVKTEDGKETVDSKAIQEFGKKCVKTIDEEHTRHKAAMSEMCKDLADGANSEAKGKGQVADELANTEVAQQKYAKINKAYDVFYAFVAAYLDEDTKVEDYETMVDEMVDLMKGTETKGLVSKYAAVGKASRKMSSKNREAIKSVLTEHEKSMEAHEAAMDSMHETHKSHKALHAALKRLVGDEPQGSDEGKDDTTDSKTVAVPAPSEIKVDKPNGVTSTTEDGLKTFLADRALRKDLKSAMLGALNGLNKIDELAKNRRR